MSEQGNNIFRDLVVRARMLIDRRSQQEVDKSTQSAARAVNQMTTALRRTAQLGISMSTAFGTAIDQSYTMGIEAGLLTIELTSGVIAAESLAGYGFLKAGAQAAAVASILITIGQLEAGRSRNAQQMQGVVSMFRLLTF
jgi:hypothetical protein